MVEQKISEYGLKHIVVDDMDSDLRSLRSQVSLSSFVEKYYTVLPVIQIS